MRAWFGFLVACGSSVPPPVHDSAPPDARHVAGCAGRWSLVELYTQRTSCSGLARRRAEVFVDVVDGAYRARHASGGFFKITTASALGEDCRLGLAEWGHQVANDTSYEMEWQLGGAARGVYRDLEAWTECTHEFGALAVRRALTAADTTLDVPAVSEVVRAWWPRYASCRRVKEIRRDPGRATVPAEVTVLDDGRVTTIRARGRTHEIQCSQYSCECLEVANPTGQLQTVAIDLPVP